MKALLNTEWHIGTGVLSPALLAFLGYVIGLALYALWPRRKDRAERRARRQHQRDLEYLGFVERGSVIGEVRNVVEDEDGISWRIIPRRKPHA